MSSVFTDASLSLQSDLLHMVGFVRIGRANQQWLGLFRRTAKGRVSLSLSLAYT